jgi:N6-L-threonylcarbamoyladenine synthase
VRVLGIETSCDETAAAVVTDDGAVLSDVVRSQIALHAPYGGVVPEIASRDHALAIVPVVREALDRAEVSIEGLDGIAVTSRPGLSGALLVGLQTAKGMAWAAGKPLIGVDHLVGHLLAVFLRRSSDPAGPRPSYPFIGLLVSGGHTALYRVEGHGLDQIRELGATRDDAAGEAFDKVAKLLGLGYPGGPAVDRLAAAGDPAKASGIVPVPMAQKGSLEFSFSGIKAAVARHVAARRASLSPLSPEEVRDLCAAFQATVTSILVKKTILAARREDLSRVVVAGGVAANRGLRALMTAECARRGIEVLIPPFASCTDNAAMIAYAGAVRLAAGERDGFDLAPATVTSLLRVTRKGRGQR